MSIAPEQFDLVAVVVTLSDALDLVGVDDVYHGKRVAFVACEVAAALGWDAELRSDLFLCSLLHDVGVSGSEEHQRLVGSLDWSGSLAHCLVGAERLAVFAPLAHLAPAVRHHHDHWDSLVTGAAALAERDRDLAAIIFLADRLDSLQIACRGEDLLRVRGEVLSRIASHSGTLFAPHMVAALEQVAQSEAFWITLEPGPLLGWLGDQTRCQPPRTLSRAQLRDLALVFAGVVDAKSPFTAQHSEGVARVARRLGERVGLSPDSLDLIEVAALLHDIGKLRVPDAVLDKPGKLDDRERATMLRHSFHTWEILHRIEGFETLAQWAAFHHEELNGGGYPFHKGRWELTIEPRIVAVADVYQALAQDRPYRAGLAPDEILRILRDMAVAEKLDADLVEQVAADLTGMQGAALGEGTQG